MSSLYPIAFKVEIKKLFGLPRYRNSAEIKPPFSYVNKSPIRCGFRAGVRAIRYTVDIA